jgi:DNA-directed RNA polymerase specialized sigma24 family protein
VRTDEELAEDLRGDDERAFARLYEGRRTRLFVFSARLLGSAEAGADVVQDTFLALRGRRHTLPRIRSFRAWPFTAGRNRCLTLLRGAGTRARLDAARGDGEPFAPASAAVESDDEARIVRETLMAMPPEHREVLMLRE